MRKPSYAVRTEWINKEADTIRVFVDPDIEVTVNVECHHCEEAISTVVNVNFPNDDPYLVCLDCLHRMYARFIAVRKEAGYPNTYTNKELETP